MIKFSLKCKNDHRFDSWFGSNLDFEKLKARNLINCAVCGSENVEKAIMAPRVSLESTPEPKPLSQPKTTAEQSVLELRKKIEAESEDVGKGFALEARRIHDGDAPNRPIIGEARPAEALALIEDGVPILPVPWTAKRVN